MLCALIIIDRVSMINAWGRGFRKAFGRPSELRAYNPMYAGLERQLPLVRKYMKQYDIQQDLNQLIEQDLIIHTYTGKIVQLN